MSFHARRTVRFADCDLAGIVYFPQYLVMSNTLVEQWFDEGLGVPYAEFLGRRRMGLPIVRLECDFTAVSRHGDELDLRLGVKKLGRSSLMLAFEFSGGGELRLRSLQTLVCTSLATHRPQALPDDLREAVLRYIEPETNP